jgi:uncharacterized protein
LNAPQSQESSPLQIRGPRASSVIVQHVPPNLQDPFLTWQRNVSSAASLFHGYQTTEAYPPVEPSSKPEWVVVIHFDTPGALENWLTSPERAHWMDLLPPELHDFSVKTLPTGLGSWFALTVQAPNATLLPHWKAFLTVLLGLYPAVMLLNIFLAPHLKPLGIPLAMLIGNAASVSFLEYLGMPALSRLLSPWLHANTPETRPLSYLGAALLLAALALMTYLFTLV